MGRDTSPNHDSRRRERRPSPTYDRRDGRDRGRDYRGRNGDRGDGHYYRGNPGGGGRRRERIEGFQDRGGRDYGDRSTSFRDHGDDGILTREEDKALRNRAGRDDREYRRLKRLELAGKVKVNLWAASPSPPPLDDIAPAPPLDPKPEPDTAGPGETMDVEAKEVKERRKRERSSESASDEEEAQAQLERFKIFLRKVSSTRNLAPDRIPNPLTILFPLQLEEAREQKIAEEARLEEESKLIGPARPEEVAAKAAPGTYGKNLLPGEGDAMAAYVQSGQRIPRRGEIGLVADQIAGYEDLGYVMSGNRHSRMNAIRIRKENQVYSAEEKAALAMINFEEKKAKEQQVMQSMQALVKQHLQKEETQD